MFNLFKNKQIYSVDLYGICESKVVPIEKVNDITFSSKLLGDGVAFEYKEDIIYSPCDATVILVSNTKHAIGLRLKNGAELLIHCGLDTVNLKGKGLQPLVTLNDKVKQGKPLLKLDREFLDKNNIDLITPIVITNVDEFTIEKKRLNEYVSCEDVVMTITKK